MLQLATMSLLWAVAPETLFPSPTEVWQSWKSLALTQGLLSELGASASTILQALAYSSIISAVIAYAAAINILKPISSGIASLRFLGFTGLTFLFTLATDSGSSLKLMMLVFGMTVFQVTNMVAVTNSITQNDVDYAKSLRLSGFASVYELLIRGKLHEFLDIIRQNAAIGWTLLSMVEGLVRSDGGIGSLLITQSKFLNLSAILAIQLTILSYGIFQDIVLGYIRVLLCPHISLTNTPK